MTDVKSQMASTFLQGEKYLMFSKNKTQKRQTNTANTALMHKGLTCLLLKDKKANADVTT